MVPNLKIRIVRKIRVFFHIPIIFRLGHLHVLMPAEHLLLEYKKKFPNYDRFLPILAKLLPNSSNVIDVGSNIGDTAVAMYAQNRNLIFHCFEPNKRFFRYLKFNTRKHKISFFLHQIFVSCSPVAMKLDGRNGTRWRSGHHDWKTSASTLDKLFSNFNMNEISLLKSDVDGWDFDVINSSWNLIEHHKPLIFFEMYTKVSSVFDEYLEIFKLLSQKGYTNVYIFKNTGEFFKCLPIEKLGIFLTSNFIPNIGFRDATYFDLLCSTKSNDSIALQSVEEFLISS